MIEGRLTGVKSVPITTRRSARTPPAHRDSQTSRTARPSTRRSARSPSCREAILDQTLGERFGTAAGKVVAPAVDELLDREERDQSARQRDRGVKRGERRHRRHAEIAEPGEEIKITK